jgi:large subunit ribosomal protein L1
MPSNRFNEAKKLVDKTKIYTIKDAVALAKKTATAKYDEAIELHVRIGIDPSKSDQQVRGTIALPHGTGKTKKVAAFVEGDKEAEAKAAGADIVGGEELINKLAQTSQIDFDVAVATPVMMPKLAKVARLLGPRGLMPNPKTDTVSPNITKIIQEQKAGKESFKNDNTANIHQVFGRKSFTETQLEDNLRALLDQIKKLKPSSSKGIYIRNAVIASTIGPGIKIDANS